MEPVNRFIRVKKYVRRIFRFLSFTLRFFGQFIKANLEVAKLVLFVPTSKFNSGFVDYSIEEMTFKESLLLSHCITLTPGTITVDLDWDRKVIKIHVLNLTDSSLIKNDIDQKLKLPIWRFTR